MVRPHWIRRALAAAPATAGTPAPARPPARRRRVLAAWAASTAVVLALAWRSITPSNHRTWIPEQAVMPYTRFDGTLVHVRGVRNFRWQTAENFVPDWEERTYDLGRIQSVWFVLSPFGARWRGPAHAMLSFSFTDSTAVAVSVEARKQPGEGYSIWKGLLRRYELLYVVADERDVLSLRAIARSDDVYLYPLRVSPQTARDLLVSMLVAANGLARRPRFYNTLTANCTTILLHHANQLAARPLPGGWRVLLPGYSDGILHQAGLLDTDLPLAQARVHFRANDRIRDCLEDAAFSACMRRAQPGQ